MMAGVDMVHVPYRGGAPALTDLLGGQVQVMFPATCLVDRVRQGRQAARAGGDHGDALGGAAGHPDRRRFRAGLRGERAGIGVGAPKNTPTEIVDKLNKEINAGARRSQDQGAACRPGRHGACRLSPADFGKLIADETEKWGKVIKLGRHQAGVTPSRARYSINPFREWLVSVCVDDLIK